jgi:hypothetical protein
MPLEAYNGNLAEKYESYIKGPDKDQPKIKDPNNVLSWDDMCDKGFAPWERHAMKRTMVTLRAFLEEEGYRHPYFKSEKALLECRGEWREPIGNKNKISELFPPGQALNQSRHYWGEVFRTYHCQYE